MFEQDLRACRSSHAPRHQAQVARRASLADVGLGQVRIDVEVELGRALLDPAQHQVLDRIEADGAQGEGHA